MIDLADRAASLIADCLIDSQGEGFDLDALREEVSERAHEAADSACIYYHDCADIIRHYESDPRADTGSADESGVTFKPSEYQQAMGAYAFYIAQSIIEAEAFKLIDDHLGDALASLVPTSLLHYPCSTDFRLSRDCPHGWAAHDREDDAGACYWVSGQLDGCNAVAVPAAGVWVSYTWDPLRPVSEPAGQTEEISSIDT